jgi:hypothetical protein
MFWRNWRSNRILFSKTNANDNFMPALQRIAGFSSAMPQARPLDSFIRPTNEVAF